MLEIPWKELVFELKPCRSRLIQGVNWASTVIIHRWKDVHVSSSIIRARVKCSLIFFFFLFSFFSNLTSFNKKTKKTKPCLQLLAPQEQRLFHCLVKQALKRASGYHRERTFSDSQKKKKKSAIIYVSTSAMWEDKFIDILMIILDHSPLHSSTAIQHTLVSSWARPTSHLSGRRKWVRVDIKIKDAWREKPRRADRACQAMFVSKHDLQKGKWVPLGAWEVWLCEK